MRVKHSVCPPNTRQLKSNNLFVEEGFEKQAFVSCPRILFFDNRITKVSQIKLLMFLYYVARRFRGSVFLSSISKALGYTYGTIKGSFKRLQELGYITVKSKQSKTGAYSFIILNFIQDPRKYHVRDMLKINRQRRKNLALRFQRVNKKKKEPKVYKVQTRIYGRKGWYITGPLAGKTVKEEYRHLPTPEKLKGEIEKWRLILEKAGEKQVLIKSTEELKKELQKKTCTSGSPSQDSMNSSLEESANDVEKKQDI